jgi:hypothetical protein
VAPPYQGASSAHAMPAAPVGAKGLYVRNQYAAMAVLVAVIYVLLDVTTHFVLLGIVPIILTVRSFMRKEQFAFVAAIAAVGAIAISVASGS